MCLNVLYNYNVTYLDNDTRFVIKRYLGVVITFFLNLENDTRFSFLKVT